MAQLSDPKAFKFIRGIYPVVIITPHAGLFVPDNISQRFTESAKTLKDTDWWISRLMSFATSMGCTSISAEYSRYVVDLNRHPDNTSLYSGPSTGLVPDVDFDGKSIYRPSLEPTQEEKAQRISKYWLPYHEKIKEEIAHNLATHGVSIQLDAHSIRSQVPRLFSGTLPDLNIGSYDGKSASPELVQTVSDIAAEDDIFSVVVDARFKGGYITRNYGDPAKDIHAIQIEISQKITLKNTLHGLIYLKRRRCFKTNYTRLFLE